MVKKIEFIKRILQRIDRDLNKILPDEDILDEMYEKLKIYLKGEFCK